MKLRTTNSEIPSPLKMVSGHPRGRHRGSRKSSSRVFYLLLLIAGAVLGLQFLIGLVFVASAPGILHAGLLEIGADREGRIVEISAKEGTRVSKGTVLARIAVPGGDEAVQLAAATVERLAAEIEAERRRAMVVGTREASRVLAQIGELRDRGLVAQAELSGIGILIKSYAAQIQEIDRSIVAFDELSEQEITAAHSYLDLRVQKLQF